MNDSIVDPLLDATSARVGILSDNGMGLERSEYDGALKLVLYLLNDKGNKAEKRTRLERALAETLFSSRFG